MRRFILSAVSGVVLFCALSVDLSAAAVPPKGFEDPGLIDSLKKGIIIEKEQVSTSKEFRILYKSYFHKVTAAAYLSKAEEHDNFKNFFSEIKDSARLSKLPTGRKYEYEMTMNVSTPIGVKKIKPKLKQTLFEGATPDAESYVSDEVINYEKEIKDAGMGTRIIPYEDGLLVAHTVRLNFKKYGFVGNTKSDFRKGQRLMIEELRLELKANP